MYSLAGRKLYVLQVKRIRLGAASFSTHAERLSGGRLTQGKDAWPASIAVESEECKLC